MWSIRNIKIIKFSIIETMHQIRMLRKRNGINERKMYQIRSSRIRNKINEM